MRNKILFVLVLSVFTFTGCVNNAKLPQPTQIGSHPYGAIIELYYRSNEFLSGELIAVNDSSIILLSDRYHSCMEIPKEQISSYGIQFAQPKHYGLSILLLPLSTISHGFIALITFPINFVTTIIITSTSEYKYTITDKNLKFEQLGMYARFPQGIPEGINLIDIK